MTPNDSALSGATLLADWGLIRVSGPEALAFLNGQLTQQMTDLRAGQARLAGYCSPKGRLLASFVVWRAAADDILLACSADLVAATSKRLSMFVLRAKCRVLDVSALYSIVGHVGPPEPGAGASALPWQVDTGEAGWSIAMPPVLGLERRLRVQSTSHPAPSAGSALDIETWRWLEASSGLPRIVAATAEQFVPQMVNFELIGGVDFRKGCFPGQEVVARSQYRGTLKRRTFLFDSDRPALPGQEIVHSDDPSQPAGLVVNAGTRPGHPARVLAEVKLAALESGTLHLASLDTPPLRRVDLPYSIAESVTA